MALGGVLRAALKAGDWARAAAQSRRQARALRQFSPEFGERPSRGAGEFLRSRGVDSPDDRFRVVVPPWTVSEGFSNRAPLRFPLGEEGLPIAFNSRTARGNALYIDPNTGRRLAVNPDMLRPGYSDIVSPFERAIGPVNPAYGTTRQREAISENLRNRYANRGFYASPEDEFSAFDNANLDLYNRLVRRYNRNQPVPSWWEYPYEAGGMETYGGNIPYHLYPMNEYISRNRYLPSFSTQPLPIDEIPF